MSLRPGPAWSGTGTPGTQEAAALGDKSGAGGHPAEMPGAGSLQPGQAKPGGASQGGGPSWPGREGVLCSRSPLKH